MRSSDLSIIIPVYNDGAALAALLQCVAAIGCEVLVVDAGSNDLPELPPGMVLLHSPTRGRGQQLAYAATRAKGSWLWMLHADSQFDSGVLQQLWPLQTPAWGRFDVRLNSQRPLLRAVAALMNWRSRYTGICTGDQGVFVHRSLLEQIGGVPAQPLMEDIELSRRLKRGQMPLCLPGPLKTSARRWEQRGIWRTITHMWWLRFRYWAGASPESLAAKYYGPSP